MELVEQMIVLLRTLACVEYVMNRPEDSKEMLEHSTGESYGTPVGESQNRAVILLDCAL